MICCCFFSSVNRLNGQASCMYNILYNVCYYMKRSIVCICKRYKNAVHVVQQLIHRESTHKNNTNKTETETETRTYMNKYNVISFRQIILFISYIASDIAFLFNTLSVPWIVLWMLLLLFDSIFKFLFCFDLASVFVFIHNLNGIKGCSIFTFIIFGRWALIISERVIHVWYLSTIH